MHNKLARPFALLLVVAASACGPPPAVSDAGDQGDGASADATTHDAVPADDGAEIRAMDSAPDASEDTTLDAPSPPDATGSNADAASPPDGDSAFVPASHPAFPQIPYNGGTIFHGMTLFTILTPNDPDAAQLTAFTNAIGTTQWWQAVSSEYGVGNITQAQVVQGPAITTSMSRAQIIAYIQAMIESGTLPSPDGTRLYLLFYPPGVDVTWDGNVNTNCQYVAGYHHELSAGAIDSMALIQRCPANAGSTVFDDMTTIAGHEIAEAATDPDLVSGYSLNATNSNAPWLSSVWATIEAPSTGAEIGDACDDTRIQEGGFWYQRIWSNTAAALGGDPCITPSAAPYVDVAAAQDWYAVSAGNTTQIPVTGWSNAPSGEWQVGGILYYSTPGSTFDWSLTAATQATFNGATLPAGNNGSALNLQVTASQTASGDYVVFWLVSTAMTSPDDRHHVWPVGVYVN